MLCAFLKEQERYFFPAVGTLFKSYGYFSLVFGFQKTWSIKEVRNNFSLVR